MVTYNLLLIRNFLIRKFFYFTYFYDNSSFLLKTTTPYHKKEEKSKSRAPKLEEDLKMPNKEENFGYLILNFFYTDMIRRI